MTSTMVPLGTDEAVRGAEDARAIVEQLGRVVLGQDEAIRDAVAALIARGHVLLEGVPGTAKTLLVRALSQVLSLEFRRIQFTPDLMPSDITGVNLLAGQGSFTFRPGPIFGDLVLGDEINRAPAKTQAALLEVMQEGQVTIEGRSYPLAPPFMAIATQNPVEQEGTYPLPEAQLDRFLLKVQMAYPGHDDEVRMVGDVSTGRDANAFELGAVRQVIDRAQITAMQQGTALVAADPVVLDYAVRVARATREWPGIALGAGPRGSLSLVRAGRAWAVLQGRDFVVPDDIRAMARPALRHRLTLAPELQIEGMRVDAVIDALLAKVEAPRR